MQSRFRVVIGKTCLTSANECTIAEIFLTVKVAWSVKPLSSAVLGCVRIVFEVAWITELASLIRRLLAT